MVLLEEASMPVCGIVAEFNPFHNGHAALLKAVRASGADTVVCVMSGNFVQRGSFAITDKRVRARAALENGADLIIELPLPSAVATAQRFARGAVHLLAATGIVDMLAFGSESGDISELQSLSRAIDDPQVTSEMRRILRDGVTFAKARELAVAEIYGGQLSSKLAQPNNVLGIEYMRQMRLQKLRADAFTIQRIGAAHHASSASNGFTSASYLRDRIADFAMLSENVPPSAASVYAEAMARGIFPSDASRLETAMLAHLRRLSISELACIPDISEGLENRFYAEIRKATTLIGLEAGLKTKRYTLARIRRMILAAFLGLRAADCEALPPYVRVLGFNTRGRSLLTTIKKRASLPVDTSLASIRERGGICERFASLEELSSDMFALTLPKPLPCGFEYTAQGVYLK